MSPRRIGRTAAGLLGRVGLGVWLVATLAFTAIHLLVVPETRATILRNFPERSVRAVDALVRERVLSTRVDLAEPIPVQYVEYIASVFQGRLGVSTEFERPVVAIVGPAALWNLLLLVLATAFAVGFLLLYTRVQTWLTDRDGRFTGRNAVGVTAVVPWYLVAFVAILVAGYWLEVLPTGGKRSPFVGEVWSLAGVVTVLEHAILPASALGVGLVGYLAVAWVRQVEDALDAPATRRARVRGLAPAAIRRRYVLPRLADGWRWNGLTVTAWVLGYTVILEVIFNYRALGWYLFEGVENPDYPLLVGCTVGLVVLALLVHAVVDLVRAHLGIDDGAHLARSLNPEREQ